MGTPRTYLVLRAAFTQHDLHLGQWYDFFGQTDQLLISQQEKVFQHIASSNVGQYHSVQVCVLKSISASSEKDFDYDVWRSGTRDRALSKCD